MTPEQARAMYEAMSPEDRARFVAYVGEICEVVTRLDQRLTERGQELADDAEAWLERETR